MGHVLALLGGRRGAALSGPAGETSLDEQRIALEFLRHHLRADPARLDPASLRNALDTLFAALLDRDRLRRLDTGRGVRPEALFALADDLQGPARAAFQEAPKAVADDASLPEPIRGAARAAIIPS